MNLEDVFYKKILRPIIHTSTLGRQSIEGTADTGFNFDYMYRNIPSGDNALGKVVDSILLQLPAVRATRNRKDTIKRILRDEAARCNAANKLLYVLDVASGPARYLVEAASEIGDGFRALCLDNDARSLAHGCKLAQQYQVADIIEYRQVNIFNDNELYSINFKPDFIIVSGLYVYHDTAMVTSSLEKFARLLDSGKKILVDNQISNPSKKLMEKICTTTMGQSWKLYYRTEEEMKALLSDNFKDVTSLVDTWGMYNILTGLKR